jgi:hypothetical protein
MSDEQELANENVPASQWYKWIEAGRRYESNWQTRKAIAAIKPKKKKRQIQMPDLPFLDGPASNKEDDPDSMLS